MAVKPSEKTIKRIRQWKKFRKEGNPRGNSLDLRDRHYLTEMPEEVFDLTWLEVLDFGNYKEERSNHLTEVPPGIGKLVNLQYLDLKFNQIKHIADELAQLTLLNELMLADNEMIALPAVVGELPNLTRLNLNNNVFTEPLPESLEQLSKLRRLELSNCGLKEFPAFIFSLKELVYLDLSNNFIEEIPEEISQLTNLETLSLGNSKEVRCNHISAIPPGMGKLVNLQHLDLTFNKVKHIPEEFGQLTSLKSLMLNDNQMTALPPVLGELENLVMLNLTNNTFTEPLPESLGQLSMLYKLKLNNCGLKEFPAFILSLKELVYLDLNNNFIEDVPEEISELKNLTKVFLNNNELNKVPKKIYTLPNIKEVGLVKNSKLERGRTGSPSSELMQQGVAAVQSFYRSEEMHFSEDDKPVPERDVYKPPITLDADDSIDFAEGNESNEASEEADYINEVKLLLVGEGRVGKTSIARALRVANFKLEDQQSTEGIDINQWIIPKEEFEGKLTLTKDFRLNVWDFGGQEIYYSTHQFFLTRRSIYLFVTESRKEDNHDTFFYWLNLIKLLGDESPVVFVLNKIDQPTKELPFVDYKEAFPNIVEFKKVSCEADYQDTVVALKEEIKRVITNQDLLPQIGASLPKVWVEVRNEIEALQDAEKNFISYDDYLDICEAQGMDEEQAAILSRYFHDLGVFLHFDDDIDLTETVFLNHEWVTKGVYNILDNPKVKANQGRFTDQDLMDIWKDRKYKSKRRELLSLMKNHKFELCFTLEPGVYLAPQLLPANPVTFSLPDTGNKLAFEYRYDFMPKGLLTRFIVKQNSDIYENIYWQYGVVLYYEETYAVVREHYLTKRITITLTGEYQKQLLGIIRKTIQDIHSDFNNLEVAEMIPCHCSECKDNEEPYFYVYNALKRRLDKGVKTVECDRSFERVDIVGLLDGVGGSRDATLKAIRRFVAKNQVDRALNALEQYAEQLNDWEIENTTIALKASWRENELSKQSKSAEQYNVQREKIVNTILELTGGN